MRLVLCKRWLGRTRLPCRFREGTMKVTVGATSLPILVVESADNFDAASWLHVYRTTVLVVDQRRRAFKLKTNLNMNLKSRL